MTEELILDSQIRDWVLLPIMIVTIVLSLFRVYFARLFSTSSRKPDFKQLKDTFLMRKQYFNDKATGALIVPPKDPNVNPLEAMTNPAASGNMVDMMKKNLANVIIQPLMMSWVSYFFTGFVLVKLPFPLTLRFKSMFQRGVESLDTLDVSYVSALSWYFVVLFGLMGVNSLILGGEGEDVAGMVDPTTAAMMGVAQQQAGPGQDSGALMTAERENLELTQWTSGANPEKWLLAQQGLIV